MSCMRRIASIAACLLFASACQSQELVRSPGSAPEAPSRAASPKEDRPEQPDEPTEKPSPPEKDVAAPPSPDARLPKNVGDIAEALETAHRTLDKLVRGWAQKGASPGTALASNIELWALYQQRLYRSMAESSALQKAVIAALPKEIARAAAANTGAQSELRKLNQPVKPPIKLPRTQPAPAGELLTYFKQAERRFDIPWYVLASVNFIETRFGRLKGPSSAGALGPMQFLPSTWDHYGAGGDIFDPHDAILGAARYLSASGAPGDMRGALYAYNNSDLYVSAILDYALQMRADPRDYYAYYNWQVFVRTTKGDFQLTGPGRDIRG
jgi:hypothetical protein